MATVGQNQVESNKVQVMENLDKLWRPFLMLSRAVGVFPFVIVKNERVVRWWRNWWNVSSVLYVCIACVFLIFMVINMLAEGVSKVGVGAVYLSNCAFYLHVILSTVTFVYFLNTKPYLNDLCRVWSSMQFGHNAAAKLNADIQGKIKFNLTLTGLGCIIYIFAIVGLFLNHGAYEDYEDILLGVFMCWCLIANAIQLGLFCTVCGTSSCLLKNICQDLETKLTENCVDVHLKWLRDVFMAVVDFVEIANQLFGRYVGFLVTFLLIETCCNTYLFFPYGNLNNILLMVCDLILAVEGLVIIIIVCLSAGKIAEEAERPFRILLKLQVAELPSNNHIQEVILLLDCSKNLEAKICMFGIMPITKESLPMIFGIYLSYVFMLYQFPQGLDNVTAVQAVSNCTASL